MSPIGSWTAVAGLAALALGACAAGPRPQPGAGGGETPADPEATLRRFIAQHVEKAAAIERQAALAYWKATTTGDAEAYERVEALEVELRALHADPEGYALLERIAAAGAIEDPRLARQLALLRNDFAANQVPAELRRRMVKLSTRVQKTFSAFRGQLDGQPVGDNAIKDILRQSTDSARRRAAWEAYKAKGAAVRDDVLELVRLRNQAARRLGHADFYQMRLALSEQDPARIQALFDELARLTDAPFAAAMEKLRAELAERYGVAPAALEPWHLGDPFFQEPPRLRGVELDPLFAEADPRQVVGRYFAGIGLDPGDILERSDLYEKKGKMPHAYCTHIDRSGDVRILANLQPDEQWTATLMHEMGHAVYDRYLDMELPWLLREPAHAFVTEAVAMLFGRQTRNPVWLRKALGAPDERVAAVEGDLARSQRLGMLVFARWAMVMMNFERQLYADPDQDLNALWWKLKERYQLVSAPQGRDAPDWASKIHIAVWPAYYHNYLLGELLASQLLATLADRLGAADPNQLALAGHPDVGAWLKSAVFAKGASLRWDALVEQATGQPLDPRFFVEQFVSRAD